MRHRRILSAASLAALACTVATAATAADQTPAGKRKPVERALAQHLKALHECDANALVKGYSSDAKLFFPDGTVVTGRAALRKLYAGFVKSREEGGLCGLHAKEVDRFRRGGTVFVKFRVTAPFLAKRYLSTDGYVIHRGLIESEVSTFDASKLQFK